MKSQGNKFTPILSRLLFITAMFMWVAPAKTTAELLKPGEIIYSRAATVPAGNCDSATIWAVGQDGSNDRMITHGLHPRISPDGRLILFKRFDPNAACGPFSNGPPRWWIRDLVTKQETNISNNTFNNSGDVFSPETNRADSQIMFDDLQAVCRMNLDGTNRVCNFFTPRIFGHMSVRGSDSLVAMGVYDTNLISLSGISTFTYDFANLQKIPNTGLGDLDPSWSNDGQTIAYAVLPPGGRQEPYFFSNLFKINPDGSGKTQLTSLNPPQAEGFSYSLVWSFDNSTILNAAKLNGVAGIYKISANGGGILGTIPITPGAAPEWVGGIAPVYSERQVASFGGGLARSENYSLVDTIGQAFAGQTSSGGTYNLQSGFWTNLAGKRSRADFDGDGRSDVSVQRPSDGSWFAIRSSDGGSFTNTWGNLGDVTTPGDFDGDGKTDLAVYRASSGQWFVLRSSDSSVTIASWGNPGDVPEAGDFDGDGKTDITVYRPSTGVWYGLRSSDGGVSISGWGNPGDVPVPADYDGDGKTDVAVYRPSNGVWYMLNSTTSVQIVAWGQPGDKPVPADYDGDGKDDFGVYRPSDNNWYVLNSAGGVTIANWGNATDVPVPGDYDGDGKSDIAVFRTGNWYILNSTGGVTISALGTTGDVAIPVRYVP